MIVMSPEEGRAFQERSSERVVASTEPAQEAGRFQYVGTSPLCEQRHVKSNRLDSACPMTDGLGPLSRDATARSPNASTFYSKHLRVVPRQSVSSSSVTSSSSSSESSASSISTSFSFSTSSSTTDTSTISETTSTPSSTVSPSTTSSPSSVSTSTSRSVPVSTSSTTPSSTTTISDSTSSTATFSSTSTFTPTSTSSSSSTSETTRSVTSSLLPTSSSETSSSSSSSSVTSESSSSSSSSSVTSTSSSRPSQTTQTFTFTSLSTNEGGGTTVVSYTSVQTAPLGTNTSDNGSGFSHNRGAIIAVAVAGGLVLLGLVIALILFVRRRRRQAEIRSLSTLTQPLAWDPDNQHQERNPMDIEEVPVMAPYNGSRTSHSHGSIQTKQSLTDDHSRSSVYLSNAVAVTDTPSFGQVAANMQGAQSMRGGRPLSQPESTTRRASALSSEEGAWVAGKGTGSASSHGHGSSQGHQRPVSSSGHDYASSAVDHSSAEERGQLHSAPASSNGHGGSSASHGSEIAVGRSGSSHHSRGSGRVQFTLASSPSARMQPVPPTSFMSKKTSSRDKVKAILHRLRGGGNTRTHQPAQEDDEVSPTSPSSPDYEERQDIALEPLTRPRPPALRNNDASGSGSGSGSGTDSSASGTGYLSPTIHDLQQETALSPLPRPRPPALIRDNGTSSSGSGGESSASGSSGLHKAIPIIAFASDSTPSPVGIPEEEHLLSPRGGSLSLIGQLPTPGPFVHTDIHDPSPAWSDDGGRDGLLDVDKNRLRAIAEGRDDAANSTGSFASSLRDHLDYSRPIRPAKFLRTNTADTGYTSSPLNTPAVERQDGFSA